MYTHDVVRISGEGAHKLLNDTLTCRFDDSLAGTGRWFALLSPQGKVQIDGLVTFADDAFWFDIEAGLVADFIKRMKLYRLRAKADIEHLDGLAILWSPDGDAALAGAVVYRDERHPALGTRYIVARDDQPLQPAADGRTDDAFAAAAITAGVAQFGSDFGPNEVFAHDIGMDLLHGIDFIKGCYIGQEVVSRMKHRGTARRRPVIVSGLAKVAVGASVNASGRDAGAIGVPIEGRALAILRLDRITDLGAVAVAGMPVQLSLPDWATYQFGEADAED